MDECGNRIESKFNGLEQGKLLAVFEEFNNRAGEIHTRDNLMKSNITDTETIVEF